MGRPDAKVADMGRTSGRESGSNNWAVVVVKGKSSWVVDADSQSLSVREMNRRRSGNMAPKLFSSLEEAERREATATTRDGRGGSISLVGEEAVAVECNESGRVRDEVKILRKPSPTDRLDRRIGREGVGSGVRGPTAGTSIPIEPRTGTGGARTDVPLAIPDNVLKGEESYVEVVSD